MNNGLFSYLFLYFLLISSMINLFTFQVAGPRVCVGHHALPPRLPSHRYPRVRWTEREKRRNAYVCVWGCGWVWRGGRVRGWEGLVGVQSVLCVCSVAQLIKSPLLSSPFLSFPLLPSPGITSSATQQKATSLKTSKRASRALRGASRSL